MKRTKIKYQNIGKDKIRVVGIENCASKDEIEKEFGEKVKDEYFKSLYLEFYYRHENVYCVIVTTLKGVGGSYRISPNKTYNKEYFTNAIKWMRLAGERLGRIVKEERDKEALQIKEIVI